MLSVVSLFVLLISTIFVTAFSSDLKCCGEGEVLVLNNTNIICNGSLEFNYFNNCTEESTFCEDFNADGIVYKVFCNGSYENTKGFSKCCPLNMVYNKYNHICAENYVNISNQYFQNIGKIGLSECDEDNVIVDYISEERPNVENGVVEINGSRFETSQFCLDNEIVSGKYVVRVCTKNKICGTSISCLRKCCPDGMHYGLNKTCERYFDNGIEWQNLSGDSQRHKGK